MLSRRIESLSLLFFFLPARRIIAFSTPFFVFLQHTSFRDVLTPGKMTEIRLKKQENVITVDTTSPTARDILLLLTTLCNRQVQVHLPRSMGSLAGVIRYVDRKLSLEELVGLLCAGV